MSGRQLLPEGLAGIAPGPELSRVLADVDLSRLSGYDCVEVLKARWRLVNHERAQLMAAMTEVGLCDIGPDDELPRRALPCEFSADEVRAALVLTRRAADAQFWLAYDLVTRLPQVHAAMNAGVLDEPRARIFSEWTTPLSPEQATAVCAALPPRAPGLTTGQLSEQIKKHAISLDPEWAQRRDEQALTDRKVVGYRNADGSANLSGCNLPLDRVAAASGHIDALAKTVKRAGDTRPLDHIRAELFLGMTDGTYTGLEDTAIIELLTTTATTDTDQPDNSGLDGGEGATEDVGHKPTGEEPAEAHLADAEPDSDGVGGRGVGGSGSSRSGAGSTPTPAACTAVGAGVELRVRLSTLLGRDQYPAELAGWGPVHASLARDLAATLGGAHWRFALTDDHGQLIHCGITRARPTPTRTAASRAIVELQVTTTVLQALATDPTTPPGWARVIAELARPLDHTTIPDPSPGDANRRSPGAALRRSLEIRDRSCVMIGCRAPAHTTDKDHTHDHATGGPTLAPNLGNTCRHDHRLKHEGGWTLHQPHPGHFTWISPLGRRYHTRPQPIIDDLPDPIPGPEVPEAPPPTTPDEYGPIRTGHPPHRSPYPHPRQRRTLIPMNGRSKPADAGVSAPFSRYSSAMATIQVRDVPDDVAEIYRRRAQASGQSLQSYMREQLIAMARRRDKAEVMAIVEQTLAQDPAPGLSADTIREGLRELRGE